MYKIIKDNYIIDVSKTYLAENMQNHALVNTIKDNAHFLLASDNITLYKAPWCYGHAASQYSAVNVEAEEITAEEFESIKQQLQIQPIQLDAKEENIQIIEKEEKPQILNAHQMQQKILELEELIHQLLNNK